MAALVIIDSENLEPIITALVKNKGYQNSITGYRPADGTVGDTHWPTKEVLPANTLYHPEQNARDCCREIYSDAQFNGLSIDRVLGFDTTHWHVVSENPIFDNDKPGIKWEDFPINSGKTE